jgi:hypothetical protein
MLHQSLLELSESANEQQEKFAHLKTENCARLTISGHDEPVPIVREIASVVPSLAVSSQLLPLSRAMSTIATSVQTVMAAPDTWVAGAPDST